MNFDVTFEREGTPGWKIHDWDTANKLLSYLNPAGSSYASFTLGDGTYIQCAGAKTRLTVEARVVSDGYTFNHFVFGKGPLVGVPAIITCTVGPITVDASQILRLRDARLLIRHFVETRGFHPSYIAQDVSQRFRR